MKTTKILVKFIDSNLTWIDPIEEALEENNEETVPTPVDDDDDQDDTQDDDDKEDERDDNGCLVNGEWFCGDCESTPGADDWEPRCMPCDASCKSCIYTRN